MLPKEMKALQAVVVGNAATTLFRVILNDTNYCLDQTLNDLLLVDFGDFCFFNNNQIKIPTICRRMQRSVCIQTQSKWLRRHGSLRAATCQYRISNFKIYLFFCPKIPCVFRRQHPQLVHHVCECNSFAKRKSYESDIKRTDHKQQAAPNKTCHSSFNDGMYTL